MLYPQIQKNKKQLAVLIDPGKISNETLILTVKNANYCHADFFFIGGSLVNQLVDDTIDIIKQHSTIPVILFPGNLLQLSNKADAILLLSLISGRNPELLIGNHVIAAPFLKKSGIEVISTGYILVEGERVSSVQYMSNTTPIPANKTEIIVATALAGEMLGLKMIYLEAGSGAKNKLQSDVIQSVKNAISIPLIIGGGIKTKEDLREAYTAGADLVVVGTIVEQNPNILLEFGQR